MRIKGILLVLSAMLLFAVFLIGCQKQVDGTEEISDAIVIVDETQKPIADEIEKEFDDNLDAALEELGDIENI